MLTSQLEAATPICADLEQLSTAVLAMRREAATAAAQNGTSILATSTHPFAALGEIEVLTHPRYARLLGRFAAVVRQFNLTGCHVHIGVPDLEVAIAIMNHARQYLPVLAALTASSPFHEGIDTGWESYRLAQLALWPQGGPPPYLRSAQDYEAAVAQFVDVGLVDEPSMLLWELRPSSRYPTLEFRIADVTPFADDVVAYAGLVRGLVRALGRLVTRGELAADLPDSMLRACRWRAARYGLHGDLWSVALGRTVPAKQAVEELWQLVAPEVAEPSERRRIRGLLDDLLRRGTSATRQRAVLARTGSLRAVVEDAVALTTAATGSRAGHEHDRAGGVDHSAIDDGKLPAEDG